MKRSFGGWIILSVLLLVAGLAWAQQATQDEVQPKEVHAVKVTDPEVIEAFRRGQVISPTIAIDSVEFIDVTKNGFGQGDIMIVYPQERVFPLLEINDIERSILNQYQFEENKIYSAPTVDVTQIQQDARILESPYGGILATVVKGVDYYYDGDLIQGIFRMDRQRDVATLTLWNYDESLMEYVPGSPAGVADTLLNYDLLKVYIRELSTDTVYVPVLVGDAELNLDGSIPQEYLPESAGPGAVMPYQGTEPGVRRFREFQMSGEDTTSSFPQGRAERAGTMPATRQPADTAGTTSGSSVAPTAVTPDTTASPADTAGAEADTTRSSAPTDTTIIVPDTTTTSPADTAGTAVDTSSTASPDTMKVAPDTTAADQDTTAQRAGEQEAGAQTEEEPDGN